ncbi:MAG: ABC transporter permease subunit [Chloroflexi bacterium]|nr:ABC transporter permease subunit [Chloroflexota bacterium]
MSDQTIDLTQQPDANQPEQQDDATAHREFQQAVKVGAALPFWAVFKRELAVYFRSPVAYAIAFAVLFFLGLLFNAFISQTNGQFPADATYIPGLITFLLFLIAPLLTMRLLAEEAREGTMEVMMTLPMNETQFIIGKFLAAWAYYTIVLLLTVVHLVILAQIGIPDMGAAFGAYFGAWLYGGAVLAVSMIWSAITEDQVVAAFLGAATILVLYLADVAAIWLANQGSVTGVADFVRELGLNAHYGPTLARGVIRAEDVVYFILMIVGALFITTRIVETRRWRG